MPVLLRHAYNPRIHNFSLRGVMKDGKLELATSPGSDLFILNEGDELDIRIECPHPPTSDCALEASLSIERRRK